MSSAPAAKAWPVAASIAAVEALKDQLGFCRWNYALRSLHQHAKSNISRSYSQSTAKLSASSTMASNVMKAERGMRHNKQEESHRKVMELGCWGPESTRF